MTTELQRERRNGRAGGDLWDRPAVGGPGGRETSPSPARRAPASHAKRRGKLLDRYPAWPIVALLAGYPAWWALGVADYMFIVLAVPMAMRLYSWHARGRRLLRLPPGLSLWLLFLVCMLAGAATLSLTAPGTIASPVGHRAIAFGDRALSYLGVTVLLLFAGNLTERELPRRQLAWLLGLVGIYAVVGGIGGVLDPSFQFTSPLAYVMPRSFQSNTLVQSMLHPGLAQVQGILGGRPKAPFDYTNAWGDSLSILLPWLLVAWADTRRHRRMAFAVVVLALVPAVYSQDRGLWIGIGVSACYLAVRFAARGRLGMLGAIGAGAAVVIVLILASPLHGVISQRLQHQNSNNIRASLSIGALKAAAASPLIGYGDARHVQGSSNSIAVGPSANCIQCGQADLGSNGQFWLLLVCSGFLGTALYLSFFAFGIWRYRRDTTAYGLAGVLVLLLSFVYMFAYEALAAPLGFTMLAYALLWRNDIQLRSPDPERPDRERAGLAAAAGPDGAGRRAATARALT
jgi:hypothetical protein